jgi:hypothetical protein
LCVFLDDVGKAVKVEVEVEVLVAEFEDFVQKNQVLFFYDD